jgi:hypothetical protein
LLENDKLNSWSNNQIFSNEAADPDDIDIDEYLRKAVNKNRRESLISRPSVVDGLAKINQEKDWRVGHKKIDCKKKWKKCNDGKGSEIGFGVGGCDNEIFLKFESREAEFGNQK